MFENVALNGMFVPKSDRVTVGRKKIRIDENCNFYSHSLAIIVRITKHLEFTRCFTYHLLHSFHIGTVHLDIIKVFY